MALPIIPIALAAGAVALAKNIKVSAVDQRVEDRLDEVGEGLAAHRDIHGRQINASFGWKRIVCLGNNGPSFEVDASAFGRIKLTRKH